MTTKPSQSFCMNPVFDESGTAFALEDELARGGQGVVWRLRGVNSHLVKIGHSVPTETDRLRALALRKLSPALLDVAALPVSLAFHDAALTRYCGVFMPKAEGVDVFEMYNAATRRSLLPGATFQLMVKTARQTAEAFAKIHAHGLVIGDVNEKNLKVMPGSGVRVIDADSFQVHDGGQCFTSDVGTPLWTAPELQGLHLTGLQRTANHDLFGLAQLVFLLLFSGRHPFAGVPRGGSDLQPHEAIREHAFAYAPAHLGLPLAPPPAAPSLAMLPPRIQQAFVDAFLRPSRHAGARPSAELWVKLLGELEHELVRCPTSPAHVHWQGAGACPWCRLQRQAGVDLFPRQIAAAGVVLNPAADVLNTLQPYAFQITPEAPVASAVPPPLPPRPQGIVAWCNQLLFRQRRARQWQRQEKQTHRATIKEMNERIRRLQQNQRRLIAKYQRDFLQHKKKLESWLKRQPNPAVLRARCLEAVLANDRQEMLDKQLEHIRIEDYKIPLIGASRLAKLHQSHIRTAADLQPAKLLAAGMPANVIASLVKWRGRVARRFKVAQTSHLAPQDQARIEQMLVEAQRRHQQELAARQAPLVACTQMAHQKMRSMEAEIRRHSAHKAQAAASLAALCAIAAP
jgi:DNA-binding helix-hairpin-helix protein with protein kinase domain